MPLVNVRLFHELRTAAGKGEVSITANTLGELLRSLAESYGGSARDVIFDAEGGLREYAFVYLNNVLQKPLDMSVQLEGGDVVLVIPPVSGGIADH